MTDQGFGQRKGVPTFAEQGVDGVDLEGYIGFFGPAGMALAIVTRLDAAMQKVMETPAMKELIQPTGNPPAGGPPEKLGRLVADQSAAWGDGIRMTGLKLQ